MGNKKTILVGKENICKQIAYIFNIPEYEIIEEIDKNQNYEKYNIIICNKTKKRKKQKNVTYIEELYKQLNKKYKDKFKLTRNQIRNIVRPTFKNKKIIDKIPVELLKPSELLIKVINSKPTNIKCENIEKTCNIDTKGEVYGCCPTWVKIPFGNIQEQYNKNIYDNEISRIIKLSSMNKSYCLCNLKKCKNIHYKEIENVKLDLKSKDYPEELTISIDRSCNLKCSSCRKKYFKADSKEKDRIEKISKAIIKTGWLEKSNIVLAGQGEVFYSENYKKILEDVPKKRKTIRILSNGTLFNEENWKKIKDKYEEISVEISIDAATKETYKKLRCGNFDKLLKNLEMLGELRKQNKIKTYQFNFVVQKDNYKEMIDFISLAKNLNVDKIQFTRLNNWGTYSKKEFEEKSLIIKNKYLDPKLYSEFQNPIFKDNIVDISAFETFLKI